MTEITCLRELEEREVLEFNDIVEFTVKEKIIKYKVCTFFLMNKKFEMTPNNDEIFEILKIDKNKIAGKIYGHNRNKKQPIGLWPNSNHLDFPARTRLVKELYKIIKEINYTQFTRFEIMEI